jgi:hypothetical protein
MTPTNRLRFVEREVNEPVPHSNRFVYVGKRRILQQWWERPSMGTISMGFGDPIPIGEVHGEWRDVPIQQEEVK